MRRVLMTTVLLLVFGENLKATILPENDLHLEDDINSRDANLTEEEFVTTTNYIINLYKPLAQLHNANLSVNFKWKDSTVNAFANQSGKKWEVTMYGGLARRPEVTLDGYSLVVCHELGHHFGGYPFTRWASNEGQSDYFSTHACAKKIWGDQLDINATFRNTVDPVAKSHCDSIWPSEEQQNLCYRSAQAGLSLARLLGALRNKKNLSFSTPSKKKIIFATNNSHPDAQCRLDTYLAGSLCTQEFQDNIIPGTLDNKKNKGKDGELDSYKYTCSATHGDIKEARPSCWFKPKVKN